MSVILWGKFLVVNILLQITDIEFHFIFLSRNFKLKKASGHSCIAYSTVWWSASTRDGPDPSQAYFWPAGNKGRPDVDQGIFWLDQKRFYRDPKGWKLNKLAFFKENFPDLGDVLPDLTQPEQPKYYRTWFWKIFWPETISSIDNFNTPS